MRESRQMLACRRRRVGVITVGGSPLHIVDQTRLCSGVEHRCWSHERAVAPLMMAVVTIGAGCAWTAGQVGLLVDDTMRDRRQLHQPLAHVTSANAACPARLGWK